MDIYYTRLPITGLKMDVEEGGVEEQFPTVLEFFKGRTILVTGATGFLGKVLVEKLLRTTDVDRVYMFFRPKRGQEVKQRMDTFVQSKLFDRLKSEKPGFVSRLTPLRADVSLENAGLSPEDRRRLQEEVNVVFHCAANVRFDQKLKDAVNLNTLGTRRVLQLCEGMTNLLALVHVSTAYCHCDREIVQEVVYPGKHDPHKILDTVAWMPDHILEEITPKIVSGQPNTYAFSKNLSEKLVAEYASKIPMGIARPSIVTGTWKEPMPGWVDNLNGPTGIMIGAGKGVIRSMHCKPNYNGDFMPVDITVNTIIAMAWKIANTRPKTPMVVNVTLSGDNPVTFGHVLEVGRKLLYDYPLEYPLWYPGGSMKSNKLLHDVCVLFFHFLPAYFIDFLLMLLGKKPFMVKVQRRIQGGLQMLQYYTTKEFVFLNENLHALKRSMTLEDQSIFYMNVNELDWVSYTKTMLLGTREYCLKEDPSTLPYARIHMRRMYWLDKVTTILFLALLIWLLRPIFSRL